MQTSAIKPKANEVRGKPLLSGLVALFLLTAVYAERSAERRLDSVIRQFGGSLRDQTSNGAREALHDSPEEGYLPAVSSGTEQALAVLCEPDKLYGAVLYWYEGADALGTYYDDGDDQPVGDSILDAVASSI